MPTPPARRQLDRWALDRGYSSFDTYLQAGGSFLACRDELLREASNIDICLAYISNFGRPSKPEPELPLNPPHRTGPTSVERALAKMEAETNGEADEPPDPNNAQVQGFEEEPEQPHA